MQKAHPKFSQLPCMILSPYITQNSKRLSNYSDCVDGMEVGQYSVHKQKTEEDAYNVLAAAWNKRADVKAVSNGNTDRIL